MNKKLAIVGGSGLYDLSNFQNVKAHKISTPWGMPSSEIFELRYKAYTFCFLPRHSSTHSIPPSKVNYRANVDALKQLNVTDILSISAVGSFRETLHPGTFVIIDQYIDQTRLRNSSFFDDDIVAHVSMAYPTDKSLIKIAQRSLSISKIKFQKGATYLCIEGPQFSSLAESKLFQSWNCDVIGMTNMPEAKLCREADIRYVSIGMVTDYDCWHDNFLNVEVNNVVDTLKDNTQQSKEMIKVFLREYSNEQIEDELDVYKSIVTPVDSIKQETIIKLKNIVPSLYKDVIEKGKT